MAEHPVVDGIVTVAILVVGVASLALVLSPKATTTKVIQASASAFGNSLAVAQSPVTGNPVRIDTSYPDSGWGGFASPNLMGGGMPGFY